MEKKANQERMFQGVWIPKEIWLNEKLTLQEKVLLVEIKSLDNANGCFAKNKHFMEFLGVGERRIQLIIKNLIANGYITSSFKYKDGTKEIEQRILRVNNEKFFGINQGDNTSNEVVKENTPPSEQNCTTPGEQNFVPPGEEKFAVSNTSINNTCINNTKLNNTILNNTLDTISKDIVSSTKMQQIVIDEWNSLGLQKVVAINPGTNRYKLFNARVKQYGQDNILKAIANIAKSQFLKGQNKRGWVITFDWFIAPNNFLKVLEGNYNQENVVRDNVANVKNYNNSVKNQSSNMNKKNAIGFNNFEPRQYDYDSLEKQLLGWED
ncbi:MAG: helix-turn-helix domain-containing protein [Clostridium butyricum]|nr:helix-turn-helix domain-containing protein [Clostridium butyricum]